MSSIRRAFAVVLAASLTLVAGCGSSALNFNNSLAKANQRLASAGKSFGDSLLKAAKSDPAEAKALDDSYKAMATELEKVKKETSEATITGIDGAQDLRDAYQKYLQVQEKIVNEDFKKAVETAKSQASADEREKSVKGIQAEAKKKDEAELTNLQTAQIAFAKKHGITLKKPN